MVYGGLSFPNELGGLKTVARKRKGEVQRKRETQQHPGGHNILQPE